MPSASFHPQQIYIDASVEALPFTRKILAQFPKTPSTVLEDIKPLKKPMEFTQAKRLLLLSRMKADPLKEFKAMTTSSERPYFALNLISNCHLECTYCILQSYLWNNPILTIYTNLEEILERLQIQINQVPPGSVVGTGKIADSLALDSMTEHTRTLVPFFAEQTQATLELKTKSDFVENLKGLEHRSKTVVAWSMNPQTLIDREEYKTASFEERLQAAAKVANWGYPVAFHFDPLILHKGWKEHYSACLERIFAEISLDAIAWMSVGALRFPAKQAQVIRDRFPKNQNLMKPLQASHHPLIHYPVAERQGLQAYLETQILEHLPDEKFYRCMEF